jgi:hypothetical protein
MRRAAARDADPDTSYKPPERRIECKTLDQTFMPLAASGFLEVQTGATSVKTGMAGPETLEMPMAYRPASYEKSEFLVQLYSAFQQLANPKVCYVVDGDNMSSDPYTGLFITGESSDGETIIAQALLIQS